MQFGEYQMQRQKFVAYPAANEFGGLLYATLGLTGEAGEIANKVKKVLRDQTAVPVDDLVSELGDVMWYLGAIASELRVSLDYVAMHNLDKLRSRFERGVIRGNGDNR